MKTYEPLKLVIVDCLKQDVLTASSDVDATGGVYEHVSELDPATREDWF